MLAGGSEFFLGAMLVMLVGVIVGLYTRHGSGIDQHPYRHVHAGAPGADLPCEVSGSDRTWVEEQRHHREIERAHTH